MDPELVAVAEEPAAGADMSSAGLRLRLQGLRVFDSASRADCAQGAARKLGPRDWIADAEAVSDAESNSKGRGGGEPSAARPFGRVQRFSGGGSAARRSGRDCLPRQWPARQNMKGGVEMRAAGSLRLSSEC